MQNKGTKAGQMRLQREAKMAARDIATQLKKTGKINDGFICLPDPEDCYTWYYIVFGLDYKEFKGGFYMGKIICPPEYPANTDADPAGIGSGQASQNRIQPKHRASKLLQKSFTMTNPLSQRSFSQF